MCPLSFEGSLQDIANAAEKESHVDRKSGCLRANNTTFLPFTTQLHQSFPLGWSTDTPILGLTFECCQCAHYLQFSRIFNLSPFLLSTRSSHRPQLSQLGLEAQGTKMTCRIQLVQIQLQWELVGLASRTQAHSCAIHSIMEASVQARRDKLWCENSMRIKKGKFGYNLQFKSKLLRPDIFWRPNPKPLKQKEPHRMSSINLPHLSKWLRPLLPMRLSDFSLTFLSFNKYQDIKFNRHHQGQYELWVMVEGRKNANSGIRTHAGKDLHCRCFPIDLEFQHLNHSVMIASDARLRRQSFKSNIYINYMQQSHFVFFFIFLASQSLFRSLNMLLLGLNLKQLIKI